jgi:spermidine/putrescine transport system permease protein
VTRKDLLWFLLVIPAAIWVVIFLAAPLILTVVMSFAQKGAYGRVVYELSFENYLRMFDVLYLRIYWSSIKLAVLTVAASLLIGYPTALWMARSHPKRRKLLMVLVMLPFLTNFIIRAHGIKILLSHKGPIKAILLSMGVVQEDFSMTESSLAVWIGMVSNYLPFMILPLYAALERFDFSLVEAARDLGASRFQAFVRIVLPLTSQAIISGSILVFMPALGEFIIPDFLGGARVMLMGNLITEQFLKARDWPFGAALAVLMLATVMLPMIWSMRRRHSEVGLAHG